MALGGNRVFLYCGKNSHGQFIEGRVRAENSQWAKYKLRKKGIKLQSLRKSWHLPFGQTQSIKGTEIAQFTCQLATLLDAGIPIRRSFDIIANSNKKTAFKQIIRDINNDIFLGDSLAKSLRNHPQQFNDVFCNMVNIGEITGTLTQSLERLAQYQEKTEYLQKRVKKALTYPFIVLSITILVASVMLTKVIPNFAEAYQEFSADLPAYTQFVIGFSKTFGHIWPYLLGSLVSVYIILYLMVKNSIFAARLAHQTLLNLPLIGGLLNKVMLGRLTQILATTISAGLPIIDALKASASAMENLCYKEAILCIREDIIKGLSFHRALSKQALFPVTLQQMVDIGEESGSLASILDKAGQIYERDIALLLDTIIPLIEPVMMITLGLLVGGLLVAMYLPVFQLGHIV
jgi:type IV pilus assembly protein PilC